MTKKTAIFAILFMYSTCTYANIGSTDERTYVDWSEPPYNKIVYFYSSPTGTCTAEYVAPDIILTARHCVTENPNFDNYVKIGKEFDIWTHDNKRGKATLEKYGQNMAHADWALLRLYDPNLHRSDFFDVAEKTTKRTVTTAGFSSLAILSDEQISQCKKVFMDQTKNRPNDDYLTVYKAIRPIVRDKYNIYLDDSRVPNSKKPGEWEFKLKAHINCEIIKIPQTNSLGILKNKYVNQRGKFISTCDTWHGDSGGPYFYGGTLHGIVQGGIDSYEDDLYTPLGTRTNEFVDALAEMKQIKRPTAPTYEPSDEETQADLDAQRQQLTEAKQTSGLDKPASGAKNMNNREFLTMLSVANDYEKLRENYERALANEQRNANKILGGASIAATGAGGMMLGMGIAEKNADEKAIAQMENYVATFQCKYGNDNNTKYDTQPTTLPISDELVNLYAEYVTLANNVKTRKEQLGLPRGIESEPILNSATSGLYDDVSSGQRTGMYTSLARAVLDPNGPDATAWAEQTKKSKNYITAGAVVGGVGAVGATTGNLIINKDAYDIGKQKSEN